MPSLREKGRAGNWDYSGDPASSARDWVRFRLGDVIRDDQLVSNEEIAAAIADAGSNALAVVRLARHLSALYSREADETINDGSGASRTKSLGQRAGAFAKLADSVAAEFGISDAATVTPIPYAGGISAADIETRELDTDRVGSPFRVGMFDA